MTAGITERDEGFRIVLENCPDDYREHAIAALDHLTAKGAPFNADDVRALIPSGLVPHSPNVIGAIIGGRASAGRILPVGEYNSPRKSRHASRNRMWRAA